MRRAPIQVAAAPPEASGLPRARSFAEVVALAATHRDIQMKAALERDVRLVRFEEGAIDFELAPGASPALAQTLSRKLADWTGMRWMVTLSKVGGAPSLRETALSAVDAEKQAAAADPLVRKVLEMFPGSEVVAVHSAAAAPEPPAAAPAAEANLVDDDVVYVDDTLSDDDL